MTTTDFTLTEFADVGAMVAAIRRVRGPLMVDALAGNGYDPVEVLVVKSDLIASLSALDPDADAPFDLLSSDRDDAPTYLVRA